MAVFEDSFENDLDGVWISLNAGTGFWGGWAPDINLPSRATIRENPAMAYHGSKYCELRLEDHNDPPYDGEPPKYCLLISQKENYLSSITDALHVSWVMKLLQWSPTAYIKFFHLGTYTTQAFSMSVVDGTSVQFTELYDNDIKYSKVVSLDTPLNFGEWYLLDIAAREAEDGSGFYKAWLNSIQILDEINLNNIPSFWSEIDKSRYKYTFEIGMDYFGAYSNPEILEMHLDKIEVSNYIGAPKHHGVITSTPVQGVPLVRRKIG